METNVAWHRRVTWDSHGAPHPTILNGFHYRSSYLEYHPSCGLVDGFFSTKYKWDIYGDLWLGDLLTMLTKNFLTGMILKVMWGWASRCQPWRGSILIPTFGCSRGGIIFICISVCIIYIYIHTYTYTYYIYMYYSNNYILLYCILLNH